jgi:hypothetical protein
MAFVTTNPTDRGKSPLALRVKSNRKLTQELSGALVTPAV